MCRVLVTGGTGFVGSTLVKRLAIAGRHQVLAAVRNRNLDLPTAVELVCVGGLGFDTDWQAALNDTSIAVHCAARVHVMDDQSADPLMEFRRVNVGGTLNLARQAVEAGVRRFIFISSIKVNGEGTAPGERYTANDTPAPIDPYGISKREAEDSLREIAAESGMEVVIIRPPLVYGPGVKANFLSMMRWLHKGVPLPLGAIHNKRSLVAKDNLVDLIVTCIDHPAAANETFWSATARIFPPPSCCAGWAMPWVSRRGFSRFRRRYWRRARSWSANRRCRSGCVARCRWIFQKPVNCWAGSRRCRSTRRCVKRHGISWKLKPVNIDVRLLHHQSG